jgi:ribosome-binding protein aMBF1 (putative translation factor)
VIRNSRQASVSRKTREELLYAAEQAPPERRSSYLELAEEIGRDLEEYEAIRAGRLNRFEVEGVDSLGETLVKARLARGWTHRQLAEALRVSEQMVQRDEARLYEHAGLTRMAEVADVLGYDLAGSLRPVYLPAQMWQPPLTSVTMNVNVGVLLTGIAWVMPMVVKPQNLTSGGLLGIQSTSSGSLFDPVAHLMGGKVASGVSSFGFTSVGIGTGTFDSAATLPLELTGDKP